MDESHPLVRLDPSRCTGCGRCVAACAGEQGEALLALPPADPLGRVAPLLGGSLAASGCSGCGACAQVCPTGALSLRAPWSAAGPSALPTACALCALACPMAPGPGAPVPAGGVENAGLCRLGRLAPGLLARGPRLVAPAVRGAAGLEEVSWEAAFARAADLLSACQARGGSDAVAVLCSGGLPLEALHLIARLAEEGLGTTQVGTLGGTLRGGWDEQDLVPGVPRAALEDLAHADLVLLVGADPERFHPALAARLRRGVERGVALVVMHSERTDLARVAGAWLDPRRGTLGALLQGLAEELDGGDGRALDEAAGLAGVSQAALCGLLPRLRAARRIVAVADLDERVESGPAELVQLGALLRQLGRGSRSARLVLLRDDACGAGAALLGQERDLHPLLRAGHLHGAILVGADPLACVEIAPALRELSALVVLDAWPSTSARAARVLLPIPGPLEIEGTLLACDLAVRALVPSAAPPARRDLYAVLAGLAAALGAPDLPGDPALLRADLCAQEGFDPELLERLRAAGGRWPGRTPPASTSSLPVPPRPHPAATRRSRLQELVSARAREQSWGPAYRSAP